MNGSGRLISKQAVFHGTRKVWLAVMESYCSVAPEISCRDVMEAITIALAPADSGDKKEWKCISFSGHDSVRGDELHDFSRTLRKAGDCSLIAVEWSFLQMQPDGRWESCTSVVAYRLDMEVCGKLERGIEKFLT